MDSMSQSHVSQLPSFMGVGNYNWDPYRLIEASSLLRSLPLVIRHNLNGLLGLSNLGKNKKTVELLEQVVQIKETALAEGHPYRLALQHALAVAGEGGYRIA